MSESLNRTKSLTPSRQAAENLYPHRRSDAYLLAYFPRERGQAPMEFRHLNSIGKGIRGSRVSAQPTRVKKL